MAAAPAKFQLKKRRFSRKKNRKNRKNLAIFPSDWSGGELFGGSNYVGCKVFMKFYRADLEIWGGGVGGLRCRAVVAGAAEVGVGGEK